MPNYSYNPRRGQLAWPSGTEILSTAVRSTDAELEDFVTHAEAVVLENDHDMSAALDIFYLEQMARECYNERGES